MRHSFKLLNIALGMIIFYFLASFIAGVIGMNFN